MNDIHARIAQAEEATLMGQKPAGERHSMAIMGWKKALMGAGLAGALLGVGAIAVASTNDHSFLYSPEQQDTAMVVGKITQPGGLQVERGQGWQPVADAPGAYRQLIVEVDGQRVAIAVDQPTFSKYCRGAKMEGDKARGLYEASCLGAHQVEMPVAYTRNKITDGLALTKVEDQEKFAQKFFERYQLRKEFNERLESRGKPRHPGRR